MKTVAIVQARMGSTRLPKKVMQPICGTPLIGLLLARLENAKLIDQIVLAIPDSAENAPLALYVSELGYSVYQGSEKDVLDRYYRAAKEVGAEVIVRITGDCPLIDPSLVDAVVEKFRDSDVDYASNVEPPTYPDGLDTEVFSFQVLEDAWKQAKDPSEREHVTPFIRHARDTKKVSLRNSTDYSSERWTVDEPKDIQVVTEVFEHFHPRLDFSWLEVINLRKQHPQKFEANQQISRNEGLEINTGMKLWKRAKQVIPGGNMLLSKRAEMFLPDQWPTYFSKAKGCRVWDLDGNELLDMGLMGIGTNTLGYGHDEVDAAARAAIDAGNLSTLNAPEEVALAEKLVEMHQFADMVRFARTGGEANAIAIRIGRAASGKDGVAVCGYHGWHDWYLSANLGADDSLAGHLLPGLDPAGVPRALRGLVRPFDYNDLTGLRTIIATGEIGVIKMEVSRNEGPAPGFLEGVRQLATDNGIVLIFDECTSGFRETFGGLYKKFGVEPDLAVFGKTLGNGYAATATIGRRAVMEAAQSTFISSTFWTERIGSAAALKTLEIMERERSWERITATGEDYRDRLRQVSEMHGVNVVISGLPALTSYTVVGEQALEFKTLITQELLKRNILAATGFYASLPHGKHELDRLFGALDPIFAQIRACQDGREDVMTLLDGPTCHAGFRRLN